MLLKNRVGLITGNSREIGAATARLFSEQDASVAVNYNNSKDAAIKLIDEIKSKVGNAFSVKVDVTDFNQVKNMIKIVTQTFGVCLASPKD